MELVNGFSHVAMITEDLERASAFYHRIFDAELGEVLEDGPLRHQFVRLGEDTVLHFFQLSWTTPDDRFEMFDRGRIDHFGLTVPTVEAFLEVRDRLLAEPGHHPAVDGAITDFGQIYSIHYVDPDGVHLEINLWKDHWTEHEHHDRPWVTVEPEAVAV